ncbi:PIN domain-containing protein [Lipomyces oligophaga]|uniref:PIN domain-containing protein n=1 Tax=Lipomyces oligophaga TaxID=45792 RepID=UPI0034CEFCD4
MDSNVKPIRSVYVEQAGEGGNTELSRTTYAIEQETSNPLAPLKPRSESTCTTLNSVHAFSNALIDIASLIYVVDTNFAIDNLKLIQDLVGYSQQFYNCVVFPLAVIEELDGLKSRNRSNITGRSSDGVAIAAQIANTWLFQAFARSDPGIRGQREDEILAKGLKNDNAILDCCRFFLEVRHKPVILLSNDKNLCVKALIYNIRTVTYVEGLTAEMILARSLDLDDLGAESQKLFEEKQYPRLSSIDRNEITRLIYTPGLVQARKESAMRNRRHMKSRQSAALEPKLGSTNVIQKGRYTFPDPNIKIADLQESSNTYRETGGIGGKLLPRTVTRGQYRKRGIGLASSKYAQ